LTNYFLPPYEKRQKRQDARDYKKGGGGLAARGGTSVMLPNMGKSEDIF
jgi:hypothetical protein